MISSSCSTLGVARMQADARLVQDIHRAHQARTQRRHEVDTLAFTAGEGVAGPVQGQITQPHVHDALQARNDLRHRLRHDLPFGLRKGQVGEKRQRLLRRHRQDLMDVVSADLDPERLAAQAAAAAGRTGGAAAEAAEHVFILNLVALGLHPGEEIIDAYEGVRLSFDIFRIPDQVLRLAGKIAVGFKDGNAVVIGRCDQHVLEPVHLLAAPAGDGPVVDAFRLVRNDEILADADDLAQAAAGRAGPQRGIEAEQVFIRLPEADPVPLETAAEVLQRAVLRRHGHPAVSALEGVRDGREQTGPGIARRSAGQAGAVHQQPDAGQGIRSLLQRIVDPERTAVGIQAVVTVFLELQEQFHPVRAGVPAEVRQHIESPLSGSPEPFHHVRHAVLADFLPRHRGIGPPDTGEQKTQKIIDFRGRSHG